MGTEPEQAGRLGNTLSERDREDLARFRKALAKLTSPQKRDIIQQMLATPDTP